MFCQSLVISSKIVLPCHAQVVEFKLHLQLLSSLLVLNITYIYTGIEFPCLARKASKLKCQSTSFLTATIQSFRCCFAKCIFGVLFVVSGLLLSGDESLANFWIVFSVLSHSPESILLELFFAKARGLPSLFQCYNSVLCLHLRKICSSAVFPMYCDKFADYNSIHNVQWYCNPNFSSTVFCQNLIIYKSSLVTF